MKRARSSAADRPRDREGEPHRHNRRDRFLGTRGPYEEQPSLRWQRDESYRGSQREHARLQSSAQQRPAGAPAPNPTLSWLQKAAQEALLKRQVQAEGAKRDSQDDEELEEGQLPKSSAVEASAVLPQTTSKPKFSPIRWDDPSAVEQRVNEAATTLPAAYAGLASRVTHTDVTEMLDNAAVEGHGQDPIPDVPIDGHREATGLQQDAGGQQPVTEGKDGVEDEVTENDISIRVNMLKGCRSVDCYERICRIDEGTYGVVYRAKEKSTGEVVALKKIKMEKEKEGFPLTSIREINILLSFHHRSVVDVKEVVVGNSLDSVFMVMEYMEHDLKGLMQRMKNPFSTAEAKCVMKQLLEGTAYLHSNWVLHRDLKTSNLLINNKGEVKICDFGLARQYGDPIKPYTHMVVTLWYRPPELLLGARKYSTAVDMWSLGCIMAEVLNREPLLPGRTEIEQIDKIFKLLGTPNETIWPSRGEKGQPGYVPGWIDLPNVKKLNFQAQPFNNLRKKFPAKSFTGQPTLSELGFDLLNRLLTYDPEQVVKRKRSSRMCLLLTYSHTACRESPQRRLWIIHGSKNTLCRRTRT